MSEFNSLRLFVKEKPITERFDIDGFRLKDSIYIQIVTKGHYLVIEYYGLWDAYEVLSYGRFYIKKGCKKLSTLNKKLAYYGVELYDSRKVVK